MYLVGVIQSQSAHHILSGSLVLQTYGAEVLRIHVPLVYGRDAPLTLVFETVGCIGQLG